MRFDILGRITGMDTTYNRSSEIHHYGHFARDLSGVSTPDQYLALAQRLGASASRGDPGTFVVPRGNGDLLVWVENAFSRPHSHFTGIFMVVRSRGSYGLLATMFAPTDGKAYFDRECQPGKRQLI